MGETRPPFATSFNASLSIKARPERLTGGAGAVLVREVIERTGIVEWMTAQLHDPQQPHLVTYPLAELLRTMLVLFAQGWRDQDDADVLRLDPAQPRIVCQRLQLRSAAHARPYVARTAWP